MHHLTCEYCDRTFTATTPRKYCSSSCSAKSALAAPRWPPDSEAWLEINVGKLPLPLLATSYSRTAKSRGWPPRTRTAIRSKITAMRLSGSCTEDNFGPSELGRVLGITRFRVYRWMRAGLTHRKVTSKQIAIKAADVRQFLLAHPEVATGIKAENLAWLIPDESAIAAITTAKHRHTGPRPVVCLSTGKVYRTVQSAAKAHFIQSGGSITLAIARNGTCAGHRWAYLDELEQQA